MIFKWCIDYVNIGLLCLYWDSKASVGKSETNIMLYITCNWKLDLKILGKILIEFIIWSLKYYFFMILTLSKYWILNQKHGLKEYFLFSDWNWEVSLVLFNSGF